MNQNKVLSVRNLVLIAMFSALAAVLETIQVAQFRLHRRFTSWTSRSSRY